MGAAARPTGLAPWSLRCTWGAGYANAHGALDTACFPRSGPRVLDSMRDLHQEAIWATTVARNGCTKVFSKNQYL